MDQTPKVNPWAGYFSVFRFLQYKFGGKTYKDALELRSTVLREPLGLTYSEEDIAAEYNQLHFGAFMGPNLIGTLTLRQEGSTMIMRQVAVEERLRGFGIGTKLVKFAENEAIRRGSSEMFLHARVSARSFYESLDYVATGKEFIEVTIPHIAMAKPLTTESE